MPKINSRMMVVRSMYVREKRNVLITQRWWLAAARRTFASIREEAECLIKLRFAPISEELECLVQTLVSFLPTHSRTHPPRTLTHPPIQPIQRKNLPNPTRHNAPNQSNQPNPSQPNTTHTNYTRSGVFFFVFCVMCSFFLSYRCPYEQRAPAPAQFFL